MGAKPEADQPAEWSLVNSTTGANTVKRSAVAGKRHMVTSIVASFDGSGDVGTLTCFDDGSTNFDVTVHGNLDVELSAPLRFGVGSTAKFELSGAGGGSVGKLTVLGFTADPVTYRAKQSTT